LPLFTPLADNPEVTTAVEETEGPQAVTTLPSSPPAASCRAPPPLPPLPPPPYILEYLPLFPEGTTTPPTQRTVTASTAATPRTKRRRWAPGAWARRLLGSSRLGSRHLLAVDLGDGVGVGPEGAGGQDIALLNLDEVDGGGLGLDGGADLVELVVAEAAAEEDGLRNLARVGLGGRVEAEAGRGRD